MKKLILILLLAIAPVVLHAQTSASNQYRSASFSGTAATVSTNPTLLYGYVIINPNTYPVYIKLFNTLVGNTTVGTTAVSKTICVPASGYMIQEPQPNALLSFTVAITAACTKNQADSDTTALATPIYLEILYGR